MKTKHWYESKTIWISIISVFLGINAVLTTNFPEVGWTAIVEGVLMAVMRGLSTTGLK